MPLRFSMLWIVAGLALNFTFAFLLGMRWERGRAMAHENTDLARELAATRAAASELRETALALQMEHIAGIERLNAIARDFEVSREQQQTHFSRQQAALAALLSARPDLDMPAGTDVLRHWQASNTGSGGDDAAAESAAAAPSITDAAVSAIADAGGKYLGEFACQPRCGDGAVSPLPDAAGAPAPGDQGTAADDATPVLRGTATGRAGGGGLR